MMRRLALVLVAPAVLLIAATSSPGQAVDELNSLRQEIEALKEG